MEKMIPEKLKAIIERLHDASLSSVESALKDLAVLVKRDSDTETNILQALVPGEKRDSSEDPVNLPVLNTILEKHGKKLPAEALVAIVEATFHNMGDNYTPTLMAVGEIVNRKDLEAEKAVVDAYVQAGKNDDPGHRSCAMTVQDQLIEIYFPRFETDAILRLLGGCESSALPGDGYGDELDRLFISAFQKSSRGKTRCDLVELFTAYVKRYQDSLGLDYFLTLLNDIMTAAPIDAREDLSFVMKKLNNDKTIIDELRSGERERIEKIVMRVGKDIEEKAFHEKYDTELLYVLRGGGLGFGALEHMLGYFLRNDAGGHVIAETVCAMAIRDGERCEKAVASLSDRNLLRALPLVPVIAHTDHGAADAALNRIRAFVSAFTGESVDAVKREEISLLMDWTLDQRDDEKKEESYRKIFALLENLDAPLELGEEATKMLIHFESKLDDFIRIFSYRHKLVFNIRSFEMYLSGILARAIIQRNVRAQDLCLDALPESITHNFLAFNVACLYSLRKNKEKTLKYALCAAKLGVGPEEFLDESDFKCYRNDEDFLGAINASM